MDKSKCIILFNNPYTTKPGEYDFENEIGIDNRKTLGELRMRIAEILNLGKNDFIIRRGNSFGSELKD